MYFSRKRRRQRWLSSTAPIALSLAAILAATEVEALSIDFTDDYFQATTGHYGSAYVKEARETGSPYNLLTYTSASAKMLMGPSGTLRFGAHNLALQSQTFDNASWTKDGGTITANATAAPDGTTTADLLTENTANSEHRVYQSITATANATEAFSCCIKANGGDWVCLRANIASTWRALSFQLSTGTFGTTTGWDSYSSESLGNGWYRITGHLTNRTSALVQVQMMSADNTVTYTGNGTNGIYLWGAHVYRAPADSTYLATTSAARYALPEDYDVSGNSLGILPEEARTNLATYSEDFSNAAWTKNDTTVTANNSTAPDGTTTADLIAETATTAFHSIQSASGYSTVTSGVTYTASWFVKAGTRSTVQIGFNSAAFGTNAFSNFDLANGVLGTVGSATTATITALPDGWYRITAAAPATATATGFAHVTSVTSTTAVRFESFAGNAANNFLAWGAQFEAGSNASSYIQTFASTVTRAADNISLATSAFPFSATAGTLFAEASWTTALTGYRTPLHLDDGGSNERFLLQSSEPLTTSRFAIIDGTSLVGDPSVAGALSSGTHKMAGAYAANDFAYSVNGSSAATDTSGTLPTVTTLRIGIEAGGNGAWNGHIRKIFYLPRRATNAELQTFTSPSTTWANATAMLADSDTGLAIDFTTKTYAIARIATVNSHPYSLLTYTSPSTKMTMGPEGTLRFGAHNLALHSEDFTNAVWANERTTDSANTTTAPDGTTTADSVLENTETNYHSIRQDFTAIVGAPYEFSVSAKPNGRNRIALLIRDTGGSNGYFCSFNVSTGVAFTAGASGSGYVEAATPTITSEGNGWYRCRIAATAGNTASRAYVLLEQDDGTGSYTGNGTSGVYLWGAQISRYPADPTYLPTTTAARYALPMEWDVNGNPLGLLQEEARTNLQTYSQEFNNAAWLKGNCTITANAVVAPDGETTAETLTGNNTAGAAGYTGTYSTATTTPSASYALSVYAKPGTHRYISVLAQGATNNYYAAVFDLQGGGSSATQTSVGSSSGTVSSTSQVSVGNGWYRLTICGSHGSTNTVVSFQPVSAATGLTFESDGVVLIATTGTETLHLWGAQIEAGSKESSYIPTFSATVTRAADNISVPTTAFPYSATASTLYGELGGGTNFFGNGSRIAELDDGSANNRILLIRNSTPDFQAYVTTAGAAQASYVVSASPTKMAIAAEANNANIAHDGTIGTSDTAVTMPSGINILYIGRDVGDAFGNVRGIKHIAKILYLPRRMSNSDLQALTS